MRLSDWIERKAQELETVNRQVIFKDTMYCKINNFCIEKSFNIGCRNDVVDMESEVEEINRDELSDEFIPAIEVTFEVLKPRKRKLTQESYKVKLVSA